MKKTLTLASLIAAIGLAASPVAHADMKVGLVDMNKVFSEYYKTKDAENRINEARASAKKELDDRMDSYKKNLDAINKLNDEINKPELSKEAKDKKSKERDDKINETKNLEREIQEFRTSREKQLQEQAIRMRNGIVEEITKLIQDHVKSDQYDLVLDKSGLNSNGVPVVLYSKETNDFSADIIAELNKNRPKDTGSEGAATPSEKSDKSSKKK